MERANRDSICKINAVEFYKKKKKAFEDGYYRNTDKKSCCRLNGNTDSRHFAKMYN